ncbi:hypothetical protein [Cecembia rubra]|uniref:Carbamoyl phosphate synthase ATP-binding domain-containing protein n=1 Tax=Cecembia rubra TaxID=1485585 RepID=A0A2P8DVE2_9BACT|nr:hypothetical protein [Cecembia rubra]PSL01208.1 hypothetical protein CLV48_11410 [Cecembia rubra]
MDCRFSVNPLQLSFDSEVSHLGVLIGDATADRIISLSTSNVFVDDTLIPGFWSKTVSSIDSGFQGHLYTREKDAFVLSLPIVTNEVIGEVRKCLEENSRIWEFFTGSKLANKESPIILVSALDPPAPLFFPDNFFFIKGTMDDAVKWLLESDHFAYLAFTYNKELMQKIGIYHYLEDGHQEVANLTSLLMQKNESVRLLKGQHDYFASTHLFDARQNLDEQLGALPDLGYYVFKPSGGAAGIGFYPTNFIGAGKREIAGHIKALEQSGQLPMKFQVQEFLPGKVYGCSACFFGNGNFEMLEIHEQTVTQKGRCSGSRWTPEITFAHQDFVYNTYRKISSIKDLKLGGLVCFDFIQEKIIEVNPRLIASSPISHILKMGDFFRYKYGKGFCIHQIDINTEVTIPFEKVNSGELYRLVLEIWERDKVMCLPQGIHPNGLSRVVFINDDSRSTSQLNFLNELNK